jgi:hypothetical protein
MQLSPTKNDDLDAGSQYVSEITKDFISIIKNKIMFNYQINLKCIDVPKKCNKFIPKVKLDVHNLSPDSQVGKSCRKRHNYSMTKYYTSETQTTSVCSASKYPRASKTDLNRYTKSSKDHFNSSSNFETSKTVTGIDVKQKDYYSKLEAKPSIHRQSARLKIINNFACPSLNHKSPLAMYNKKISHGRITNCQRRKSGKKKITLKISSINETDCENQTDSLQKYLDKSIHEPNPGLTKRSKSNERMLSIIYKAKENLKKNKLKQYIIHVYNI